MLIVGDRDAPKAVSSRERALLMDLEEVLQDLTDVRVEHALSRALVAELQEQIGKAAGAEELAAEKISALEQDVEKRKEDDAVMGARVEELEAELVKEKREHKATQDLCESYSRHATMALEGLPELDSKESWLVHRALMALERLKSEQNVELSLMRKRLEGVAFEIGRLADGAVNMPAVPHEVREQLARIRALALPAEKG